MEIEKIKSSSLKVKVYKPKAFLIDFHGTICSVKWEDEIVLPYVIENLDNYLVENWQVINLMILIDTLKQESFVQRFQFNRNDAPLIEDDSDETSFRKSVSNFIKWQIKNQKETLASISIQRLIWSKGMEENKLKTIIFDDVPIFLEKWNKESIKLFIISSLSKEEMHLFLKYTSHGDLTKFITGYFDNSVGKRIIKETYLEVAKKIPCQISDLAFITDSGKEAKIATEAGAFALIILRPKNNKIREYYLTCFQSINSFSDIELVPRKPF